MSVLSDWIKDRRRTLGLTQVQVAGKLGVHQAQVSGLENGKLAPDTVLMAKIDAAFGKFTGSYVPAPSMPGIKKMSDKAREGLKAYREAKENNFYIKLDNNTCITADRNQYILKQGTNASYFIELSALIKHLVASHMRQSAVTSVKEICIKLDEIYELIEKKFNDYDPANITASSTELYIPDEDDE